jgi:hypothetical protein
VEEEPKKKAKAPAKPKAPPLTEEEKAAKDAERVARAEAKKQEKKDAKKAAEVEAKLRLEASTSRRAQRNTVRGVVRESDMVTTAGGAVLPRGKQWYGLQVRAPSPSPTILPTGESTCSPHPLPNKPHHIQRSYRSPPL